MHPFSNWGMGCVRAAKPPAHTPSYSGLLKRYAETLEKAERKAKKCGAESATWLSKAKEYYREF
jgi:hypothetical protein